MIAATSFRAANAAEWQEAAAIGNRHYLATAGDAVLKLLESQREDPPLGWPVNNYRHSLQCASRALRQGEDEEFIVCALMHDVAQELDPFSHDKIAARILAPFISAENEWVIANHQIFQLSFRTHSRFDTAACEKHRGHPAFEKALYFCERYDQNCFDPDYEVFPLETFVPMVRRRFAQVIRERVAASPYANGI